MKGLHDLKPKEGVGIPVPATLPLQQPKARLTRTKKILLAVVLLCIWILGILRNRGFFRTELTAEEAEVPWPILTGIAFNKPEEAFKKHHKKPKRGWRILNGKPAEKIFLRVPNNESAIQTSRQFATKPHLAGTPGDYDTAIDFLHLLQKELGIKQPSKKEPVFPAGSKESRRATLSIPWLKKPKAWVDVYYPVLNTPLDRSLEILNDDGTVSWKANLEEVTEDVFDPDAGKYALAVPAFHGLSRGGEVQGKLVFVNYGRKEDYDVLEAHGISLNGTIAIARYGGIFRGLKVKGAQERGAVGCLIYSDPRDDGSVTWDNGYAAYPYGPARNPTSVQRGSVQFLSSYPGDPTTPGYPSYENSSRTRGENIPDIPSLPISWDTAYNLLKEIDKGGENRTVKLVNHVDDKVMPIWNTMAVIPGYIKDEVVVVGNHRDAWVLGATDPTSGTASTFEVIRGLGKLIKEGWKPLRTIAIASWDAEEYGLIGSTEWGEDFANWIEKHVVAYLNLDSSVGGSRFGLSASPSLAHLVRDAAKDIPHPTIPGRTLWQARLDSGPLFGVIDEEALRVYEEQFGLPILEAEDFAAKHENGTHLLTAPDDLRAQVLNSKKIDMHGAPVHSATTGVRALGSGSDFTVFLQRIGVASSNGGFGSTLSDPVYHYHSVFDSQTWQERFGDPGFHRHVAVAKHLGLQLLRIADAVVLPLNTSQYAYELDWYLNEVEDIAEKGHFYTDFSALRASIQNLQEASVALDEEKADAEETLKKLVEEWWKSRHRRKRVYKLVRKLRKFIRKAKAKLGLRKSGDEEEGCSHMKHHLKNEAAIMKQPTGLGESKRLKPRVGRYPVWLKEQQEEGEKEMHVEEDQLVQRLVHHWRKKPKLAKKILAAAKRVRAVNKKLASFERGFISEEGIKDREWYRNLAVAPGKWLGYGATTFPALTEALTYDKNVTLAELEADRLKKVIDGLAVKLKV